MERPKHKPGNFQRIAQADSEIAARLANGEVLSSTHFGETQRDHQVTFNYVVGLESRIETGKFEKEHGFSVGHLQSPQSHRRYYFSEDLNPLNRYLNKPGLIAQIQEQDEAYLLAIQPKID